MARQLNAIGGPLRVRLAVTASLLGIVCWLSLARSDTAAAALPIGYAVDVDESGTTTSSNLGGTGSLTATGQANGNYGFARECEPGPSGGPFSEGFYPPLTCNGDPRKNLGRPYASKGSPESPSGFWFTGNEHCVAGSRPYSGSEFIWHVHLPQSGVWHVEAYVPEWTSYGFGTRYVQTTDDGPAENEFSQQAHNGTWVPLSGAHDFSANQEYTVRLPVVDHEDAFCHYQTADQMRWVFDGVRPIAFAYGAFATGPTAESVEGSVDPESEATSYHVAYDLASSAFCGQYQGKPTYETTPVDLSYTDATFHHVSDGISGLVAGTEYCARIVAVNGAGTSTPSTPSFFIAGAPSTLAGERVATSATSETFEGDVKPGGQQTEYHVAYDLETSAFCTQGRSPAHTTPPARLAFTDATYHAVSVPVSGLTAGKAYCAALVAVNWSGSSTSRYFADFIAGAPNARTYGARATTASSVTIEGTVGGAGQATEYRVEYDLAGSGFCDLTGPPAYSTALTTLGFTDATTHSVSVVLTGLTGGDHYCAVIVAVNGSGSSASTERRAFTAGAPFVDFVGARSTAATSATVEGSVAPAGQDTTYHVAYDTVGSEWCTTSGGQGSPAHTTPPIAVGFTGAESHFVSVTLNELTTGTRYCAALVAVNASSSSSGFASFTAGAPTASTVPARNTSATTELLEGTIDPAGQSTEYYFEYDLASSEWCTSYGGSGFPAYSTSSATLGFVDGTEHPVSTPIEGLTEGTKYCDQLIAVNSAATEGGGVWTFTTGTPPAVSSIAPKSGSVVGGLLVTIKGTGLSGAREVRFGATNATIKTDTPTKIVAESPAHVAGTVNVKVFAATGVSAVVAADRFKFLPEVTALTPSSGPVSGGRTVAVTGSGFTQGTTGTAIKFGTAKGTNVDCPSTTTCTVVAPKHAAGVVNVKVTVNEVSSKAALGDQFTYQ